MVPRLFVGSSIVMRVNPVIVLNGGSSSGKTSIARCLQRMLGQAWMTLGVDDLIRALPDGDVIDDLIRVQSGSGSTLGTEGSIEFGPDGSVVVGDDFRSAEASWYQGLAAIGRCGTGLIVDEVFLAGGASQKRLASALAGIPVVWVGVRCDAEVAEARERGRPDRMGGMARLQAEQVHADVDYNLVVDTTARSVDECAAAVAAHLSACSE
jgi:chloramphenicol 3-O phosphotransferase